ncbi:MAG: hypothetical protein ACI3WQ_04195 [Faecousia sp.]
MEKIERKVCGVLCFLMLGFYLGVIVYLNVSITPQFYISDMYEDIMVAVQMCREKTLFPSNWVFGNQLYCFATPVLAAVLYGLLNDPFLAMGIASCIMALAVLLSFDWMLKPVFTRIEERLVGAVSFVGAVVFFGDAILSGNGWQLFFTMCSYYACYAITAFLAFGCYLRSRENTPWRMLAVTVVLSFAMGIQSLRQTAVMVLPLIGAELLALCSRIRKKEKLFSGGVYVAASLAVANILGLAVKPMLKVHQVEIFGNLTFTPLSDIAHSMGESSKVAYHLFSRDWYGCKPIYYVVLCIVALAALYLVLKNRRTGEYRILGMLALSVFAIWGIDVFITMDVRNIYYFMMYPLLACAVVLLFARGKNVTKAGVMILLCAMFTLSLNEKIAPVMQQARQRHQDIHYQISEDLAEYTTAYCMWNPGNDLAGTSLAAVNRGRTQIGFWHTPTDIYPMPYLYNPAIYEVDADKSVYIFYSEKESVPFIQKAAEAGVTLSLLKQYPEKNISVYTAPVNLMALFMEG